MAKKKPDLTELESGPVGLLPSGRTLAVASQGREERLEIRSKEGKLELAIALTEAGPVLRLDGVALEVRSTDRVSVQCKRFEVEAEEELSFKSGGDLAVASDAEIRLKSAKNTWLDADYVMLNCNERTGYHDEGSEED